MLVYCKNPCTSLLDISVCNYVGCSAHYAWVKYAQKFAQNASRNLPKISLIMLFSVPIMLALYSQVANNSQHCHGKSQVMTALLEYFTTGWLLLEYQSILNELSSVFWNIYLLCQLNTLAYYAGIFDAGLVLMVWLKQ